MKQHRANSLGDYAHFFLHFGLVSGVAGGILMTLGFPPVAGTLALGATAGLYLGVLPKIIKAFQGAIDDERADVTSSRIRKNTLNALTDVTGIKDPAIRKILSSFKNETHNGTLEEKALGWLKQYSDFLGLKRPPQLLIMEPKPYFSVRDPETLREELREELLKEFNKQANAFAFTSYDNENVVLTAPIAKALDDRELKGVIAHEVGHIAAGHSSFRKWIGLIATPARLLAGLNQLFTIVTSIKNVGLYLTANIAANFVARVYGKYAELDPKDDKDKKLLSNIKHYTRHAALAGLAVGFGAPEVLVAQAINLGTQESLSLIHNNYSRCNEFQADRLAVQATEDPQGMCDALRKIEAEHKKSLTRQPLWDSSPQSGRGFLRDLFDRVKDLKKTHPNVNRRCDALQGMVLSPDSPMPA